jgi:hypothetical protein
MRAMRKIQANHIDTSAYQVPKNGLGVGCRAKCGNDLCAALDGGISQVKFCKRHGITP